MPSMMSGDAFFWAIPAVLFCLAFLTAFFWLFAQWLKDRSPLPRQHVREPQDDYPPYEQGYRPAQQTPEISQEEERWSSSPQEEPVEQPQQFQVPYPQDMTLG